MTDEELQQTIQEVSESIDKLSDSDKPLTKEEKRRQQVLLLKKGILQRIKEAKEKNDTTQEMANAIDYGLLTSFGERHPYLMHLVRTKLRWSVF